MGRNEVGSQIVLVSDQHLYPYRLSGQRWQKTGLVRDQPHLF